MRTLYPVICSDRLRESRDFYARLFDMTAVFDDPAFYVLLQSPKDADVQVAFVHLAHDSVPAAFQQMPRGLLVTIEVPSADALYEHAMALGSHRAGAAGRGVRAAPFHDRGPERPAGGCGAAHPVRAGVRRALRAHAIVRRDGRIVRLKGDGDQASAKARSSAWARSAMRSSASSMPTA